MKIKVKQGESKCVNGIWYNQGEEYEADGTETEILPIEVVKQKNKTEKKEEG
jgi:hypothetical protein